MMYSYVMCMELRRLITRFDHAGASGQGEVNDGNTLDEAVIVS